MSLLALVIGPGGRWQPGIGDPTLVGWISVVAYFAAALLSLRAQRSSGPARVRAYWLTLAVVLALLGVNKQLDLQSWLTQSGRDLARAQGWMESRRAVQVLFLAGLSAVCLAASGGVLWWLRGVLARVRTSVIGFALLLGWVVARAASFHHLDLILGTRITGLPFNSLMELGPLALIAWSAWRFSRGTTSASPGGR